MTKKNSYPGGVKLTATKARAVAMQEFGTAKGLTKEETAMPGYFKMRLGNLFIRIHPDTYDGTGCIVVSAELAFATGQTLKFLNPDTLQDDYNALERYCKRAQRDDLKDWVLTKSPAIQKFRLLRKAGFSTCKEYRRPGTAKQSISSTTAGTIWESAPGIAK